jgi:hypothetical protein
MTRQGAAAVLAGALLAVAGVAEGQMYKCKDAKGVMHYSDKPCPTGSKGAEVDIKGQPPISGKLQPQKMDPAREERDFQRRRIEEQRQAKNEERDRQARQRQCASMRSELERLETRRNVGMDDTARQQRMGQLRTDIGRSCS